MAHPGQTQGEYQETGIEDHEELDYSVLCPSWGSHYDSQASSRTVGSFNPELLGYALHTPPGWYPS